MVEVTPDDLAPVAYLQLKKLRLRPKSPVSSGQLFLFPSIDFVLLHIPRFVCSAVLGEGKSATSPSSSSFSCPATHHRQSKSQNMYRKFVFVSSLCTPIVIPTRILAHVGDIVMSLRKVF